MDKETRVDKTENGSTTYEGEWKPSNCAQGDRKGLSSYRVISIEGQEVPDGIIDGP